MSERLGRMQTRILGAASAHGRLSLGRLAWEVADAGDFHNGELTKSHYLQVRKAVLHLEEISVERSRFSDVTEFLREYPDRTRVRSIREVRQALLPELIALANKTDGGRFDTTQQEDQMVGAAGPEVARKAATKWRALEPQILEVLKGGTDNDWLSLFIRGRSLFAPDSAHSVATPLQELVRRLRGRSAATESLLDDVSDVFSLCAPVQVQGYNSLKGLLYKVISFEKGKRPVIQREALETLHRRQPSLFSGLRGYAPPTRKKSWMHQDGEYVGPEFGPCVDELLDAHMFKDVTWICAKLVDAPPGPAPS